MSQSTFRGIRSFAALALPMAGLIVLPEIGLAGNDLPSSYNADGVCYCDTSIDPAYTRRIIPTPVGGQSVQQVCERIGTGPGLELVGGTYNFPAYQDAQCGNGPFPVAANAPACPGMTAPGTPDCLDKGPLWDLHTVYERSAGGKRARISLHGQKQKQRTQAPVAAIVTAPTTTPAPTSSVESTARRYSSTADSLSTDSASSKATTNIIKVEPLTQSPPPNTRRLRIPTVSGGPTVSEKAIRDEVATQPPIAATNETQEIKTDPVIAAATEATVNATNTTDAGEQDNELKPGFYRSQMNYAYVDAAPAAYDFGGTGVNFEASAPVRERFSWIGRIGATQEYTEALVGMGMYFSPFESGKNDIVVNVGVEHGRFDLGVADLESTGGYVSSYIRSQPASRIELQGGVSYSTFFEGDAAAFASGLYRFNQQLNAVTKVEIGDNDQFSLGIRYYY